MSTDLMSAVSRVVRRTRWEDIVVGDIMAWVSPDGSEVVIGEATAISDESISVGYFPFEREIPRSSIVFRARRCAPRYLPRHERRTVARERSAADSIWDRVVRTTRDPLSDDTGRRVVFRDGRRIFERTIEDMSDVIYPYRVLV